MIFDSPKMQAFREEFKDKCCLGVPPIVFWDRSEAYAHERETMERVITEVPESKRNEWIKRRLFINEWEKFLGGWFEMMLFDWLKQVGRVSIEPDINGKTPDFQVSTAEQELIIEAKAHPISRDERKKEHLESELIARVHQINLPYVIQIDRLRLENWQDVDLMTEQIRNWLHSSPNDCLHIDANGIAIDAHRPEEFYSSAFDSVQTINSSDAFQVVNPNNLHPSLRGKVGDYAPLAKTEYPLVIAYFIESNSFDKEDVVDVWFGKTVMDIQVSTGTVADIRCDQSGIAFRKSYIASAVSGILVFKRTLNPGPNNHLHGWYIQNPYAKKPIDPLIFPVKAHFMVKERNGNEFTMGWVQ